MLFFQRLLLSHVWVHKFIEKEKYHFHVEIKEFKASTWRVKVIKKFHYFYVNSRETELQITCPAGGSIIEDNTTGRVPIYIIGNNINKGPKCEK